MNFGAREASYDPGLVGFLALINLALEQFDHDIVVDYWQLRNEFKFVV